MSDDPVLCDRFGHWLLDGETDLAGSEWSTHLSTCADCQAQWHAHRTLVVTFAAEAVPQLSPAFNARLERELAKANTVTVRPLSGWRRAAMIAYVGTGLVGLRWALGDVPLPEVNLPPVVGAVGMFVAVPLTFVLAIGLSRWMPTRRLSSGPRTLVV